MQALDRQLADLHIYANELEARLDTQDPAPATTPAPSEGSQSTSQPHQHQPHAQVRAPLATAVGGDGGARSACGRTGTLSADHYLYANALPTAGTNHVYGNTPRECITPLAPAPAPSTPHSDTYGQHEGGSGGESLYEPIGTARTSSGAGGGSVARARAQGEGCAGCGALVLWHGGGGGEACTRALGRAYHARCLACSRCAAPLPRHYTVDHQARLHCLPCFHDAYAPRCAACGGPITGETGAGGERVMVLERAYHAACAVCHRCAAPLLPCGGGGGGACYPLDGRLYCRDCNALLIQRLTAPP